MFAAFDIHISKGLCCLILLAVSVPLSLMYGSGENPKGVKIVENAIKVMIGIMLIVFIAVVCVTGINVPAMIKGLLIPKLPSGIDGMVTLNRIHDCHHRRYGLAPVQQWHDRPRFLGRS